MLYAMVYYTTVYAMVWYNGNRVVTILWERDISKGAVE
jgi:hypothetical protein